MSFYKIEEHPYFKKLKDMEKYLIDNEKEIEELCKKINIKNYVCDLKQAFVFLKDEDTTTSTRLYDFEIISACCYTIAKECMNYIVEKDIDIEEDVEIDKFWTYVEDVFRCIAILYRNYICVVSKLCFGCECKLPEDYVPEKDENGMDCYFCEDCLKECKEE